MVNIPVYSIKVCHSKQVTFFFPSFRSIESMTSCQKIQYFSTLYNAASSKEKNCIATFLPDSIKNTSSISEDPQNIMALPASVKNVLSELKVQIFDIHSKFQFSAKSCSFFQSVMIPCPCLDKLVLILCLFSTFSPQFVHRPAIAYHMTSAS